MISSHGRTSFGQQFVTSLELKVRVKMLALDNTS